MIPKGSGPCLDQTCINLPGLFDLNSAPTLPLPSFASPSPPKPQQPLMDLFALPMQALQQTLPMTAQDHLSSAREATPWQQQQQLSNMFDDIADDGAHQHQPTFSPQPTTTVATTQTMRCQLALITLAFNNRRFFKRLFVFNNLMDRLLQTKICVGSSD